MRKLALLLALGIAAVLALGAWWWLNDQPPSIAPFPLDGASGRAAAPEPALPEPATAERAPESEEARTTRVAGERAPNRIDAAAMVEIDGRVELWADFSVDAPLPPPSGEFELIVVVDRTPRRQVVRVDAGRFRVTAPADALLEATKFTFGDRSAWLNGDLRRSVPTDGKLRLIAMLMHDVVLQVVDAQTELDLRDVMVVAASAPRDHPGQVIAQDVLVEHGNSPITLPPFVERGGEMPRVAQLARLWIGAPGYAWAPARVDYTSVANHFPVSLGRSGTLVVELRVAQRLDPAIAASLQLRLWKSRGELPHIEVPALLDAPNRIDGIAGGFDVVVVSSAEAAPVELGRAEVQVDAGRESRVIIEVAPPLAARRVPIGGTIEISASWGELGGALQLTRLDDDASPKEELALAGMKVERDVPRTLRFETRAGRSGRWRASIPAYGLQQEFDVGPEGATDLRLRAPESAELRLTVVDAATQQPVAPLVLRWATGAGGADAEWTVAEIPASATMHALRVPVGPLAVWIEEQAGYGPCAARFEVQAGINEQRIALERPIGIRVKFLVAGAPVDISPERCPLHPRPLEGDGQFVQWSHVWQQHELFVSKPGRWEFRCDPLEGYAPVEPLELELTAGGLLDVSIELTRRG